MVLSGHPEPMKITVQVWKPDGRYSHLFLRGEKQDGSPCIRVG
jgi:hypothetical protein